jgi:hypothetical protein
VKARSKVVELSGEKFELRKLPPEVGSFIFMRMMGVQMRMIAERAEQEAAKPKKHAGVEENAEERKKPTGEEQVRALAFVVFSGGIGFDDFKFIQKSCMECVSKFRDDTGMPMPVMDGGQWLPDGAQIEDNVGLVMQLTSDVLVHCFADFFESGGLGS